MSPLQIVSMNNERDWDNVLDIEINIYLVIDAIPKVYT